MSGAKLEAFGVHDQLAPVPTPQLGWH